MLAIGRLSAFLFAVLVGFLCLGDVTARPSSIFVRNTVTKRASPELSSRELRSNGERMVRGLPPLRPRQLYSPTKAARAPAVSVLPAITGRVLVRKASNGVSLGYVSRSPETDGKLNVDSGTNANLHLKAKFTPTALGTTPFNIAITSTGAGYAFLGFSGQNKDLSGPASNALTSTRETVPGSVPSNVGSDINGREGFSESSIWLYNTASTKLTAIWINPNPGKATVTTEFYARSNANGPGPAGILQLKSGSNPPPGYEKVTLEIAA